MIEQTPQKEWIEGKGILVWLAFYFIELGAGTFFISSIFGSPLGMLFGWLICAVLGGGLHFLYLGHPLRAWRILVSWGWKTSWISRGLYFVSFFLVLGAIHMLLTLWISPVVGLLIAADIFAFFAVIYGGFAMSYVHSIQLWNNGLLPVLFGVSGLWGGVGVTLLTLLGSGARVFNGMEAWAHSFLVSYILLVVIYLLSAGYRGTTGKFSVKEIVAGRWALLFWPMVVGLGMALPLGIAISSAVHRVFLPLSFLSVTVLFELIGDLCLRYIILRSGYYNLLVSASG
jgi:formate-dependent nitrite reductase membrane component NrfD